MAPERLHIGLWAASSTDSCRLWVIWECSYALCRARLLKMITATSWIRAPHDLTFHLSAYGRDPQELLSSKLELPLRICRMWVPAAGDFNGGVEAPLKSSGPVQWFVVLPVCSGAYRLPTVHEHGQTRKQVRRVLIVRHRRGEFYDRRINMTGHASPCWHFSSCPLSSNTVCLVGICILGSCD